MSFQEKLTWVNATVTVIVASAYAWVIGGQIAAGPVAEIAYQRPMLVSVGAIIVLTIVLTIATAIVTAIGTQITGEGSVDDINRKDERDADIDRRGELVSYYVMSAGVLGTLVAVALEQPYFWIAQWLFASMLVAGLAGSATKLVAYRRGF